MYTAVCMLVSKLPAPHVPSDKEACVDCGGEVWIDKNMAKTLGEHNSICVECVVKREEATDSV